MRFVFLRLLCVFVAFMAVHAWCDESLEELEQQLPTATGAARLLILNKLASENLSVSLEQAEQHARHAQILAVELSDPSAEATAVNTLSVSSYYRGDSRAAIEFGKEALALAEAASVTKLRINILNNLGIFSRGLSEYDQALVFHHRVLDDPTLEVAVDQQARTRAQIGVVHYLLGELDEALEFSLDALRIQESLGRQRDAAETMNTIAVIHDENGDQELALNYYLKSLAIFEELNDEKGLVNPLNNMGAIYYARGQLEEAEAAHTRALDIRRRLEDRAGEAVSLNNLGNVVRERGELDRALRFYLDALAIKEEIGNPSEIVVSLRDIGDVHRLMKHYDEALDYTTRSLEMARQLEAMNHIKAALFDLSAIFEDLGEYEKALAVFKEFQGVEKEIIGTESTAAVAELQTKYETERRDEEIKSLREQGRMDRQRQQFFVALIALVFLVMALIWNRYRLKAKSNDLLRHKNLTIKQQNQRLEELNIVLAHKSEEYYTNSIEDALTGMYNKAYILDDLNKAFSMCQRHKAHLACIFFDIDHFKAINDSHGHLVGDRVLKMVAAALNDHTRTEDSLGRFGGEEFLLVLPNTTIDGAAIVAEKARTQVESLDFSSEGITGAITISAGLAEVRSCGSSSADELLHQADTALYEAKRLGRNQASLHGEAMSPKIESQEIDAELVKLLREKRIDPEVLAELGAIDPDGGKAFVEQIIDAFRRSSRTCLQSIEEACQTGADEELATVAHRFKGASLQVGAIRLAALCNQLDLVSSGRESGDRDVILKAVKREYPLLLKALDEL